MTHESTLVRLGIIGCGNVLGAYLSVADGLRRQGLAEVVALCGRERQRTAAMQAAPSSTFHLNHSELLERTDVDAVVVLTPMPEHAPPALAAARCSTWVFTT